MASDTRFWINKNGSAHMTSFAEINSGINRNSIVSSPLTFPINPCVTCSDTIMDVVDISTDWSPPEDAARINWLGAQHGDIQVLWNKVPGDIGGESYRFSYLNGVLTKVHFPFDWSQMQSWPHSTMSGSWQIGTGGGGIHTSYGDFAKIATYVTRSPIHLGTYGTNDHGEWWTGSGAPGTTGITKTKAFVDMINDYWIGFISASESGLEGTIEIETRYCKSEELGLLSGRIDQINDIQISTHQACNTCHGPGHGGTYPSYSITPPGGFSSAYSYKATVGQPRGWEDMEYDNVFTTKYRDWAHNDLLDNNIYTKPFTNIPQTNLSNLGLETGSVGFLGIPNDTDSWQTCSRYHRSFYIGPRGQHKTTEDVDIKKYEAYLKFTGPNPQVKSPTCQCIELKQWYNSPQQTIPSSIIPSQTLPLYILTFTDGYQFRANGLLRLFTYNPYHANQGTDLPDYPGSNQWPHSLAARSISELWDYGDALEVNSNWLLEPAVTTKLAFIKCSDINPGTSTTSGYVYLKSIATASWEEYTTDMPSYFWNPALDDDHFDINGNCASTNPIAGHEFFPHFTRVDTTTKGYFSGLLMLENGLYVGFEALQPNLSGD
jgi:hypothetical protein